MRKTAIIVLSFFISFCLKGQNKHDIIINKLKNFENWSFEFTEGKTDTIRVKNFLPEAELTIKFQNKEDTVCIQPFLEFYPVDLEIYIGKKLTNYLILKSTLYPTYPKIYKTDDYVILAWNLISYDFENNKCCECSELISELINKLELKIGNYPNLKDLKID